MASSWGRPPPDSGCEPASRPSLHVFVFRSQGRRGGCPCCCVEPLGEGHGHGPWTKGLFVQWTLGPPVDERGLGAVGFAHPERGLAELARPGLGPGGGTCPPPPPPAPGSCSSSLTWHLPPPALVVRVRFRRGLGLLKTQLHFITAPGRDS